MDSADLEHELLGACLESDIGTNHEAQMLANAEKPFYELGIRYSVQYLKKPQAIFTSPELKDIRKKVFGYLCAKVGEVWYDQHEDMFMEYVMSRAIFKYTPAKMEKAFKKEFADLFENIRSAYFNALTDFSMGFWKGATQEAYKWSVDMLFWFMPDNNVSKFDKLLRTPDVPGMIKLYHENPEEINNAHKGAKKFVEFVESSIKQV
ncbi:MAG: hypothetical protein NTY99_01090 [DPANN group archaeon]|nr:hypothetical protein [DPANN group archaeon]